MWYRLRILGSCIILACLLLTPTIAYAHTVTLEMSDIYSGGTPVGSAPWLTLKFEDVGLNKVLLTIFNSLLAPQFASEVDFNYNPLKDVKKLTFTFQNGGVNDVPFKSVDVKADSEHAGPIHNFDIDLGFSTANNGKRLGHDKYSTILISTGSGPAVEALDFDNSIVYKNIHWTAAAHVQGIPVRCGDDSAWIGADPVVPTPEPSTLLLAGLGLAAFARKRLGRRSSVLA